MNNGYGTFAKVTDSPLVNEATWSSGSAWGDYDKDGDIDLAVGGYDGDNLLFKNDGAGNFEKVLDNVFVNDGSYTEGLAWADFDDDGDLDIFTAKNNYFGGNNSFFTNNGNTNNWVKLKIIGDGLYNNYDAIGAKVFVYATIGGEPVMQMREIVTTSGGGQGGQNEMVQFFGLSDASIIDSVKVEWFFNTFYFEDLPINSLHELYLQISAVDERLAQDEAMIIAYPNPAKTFVNFKISNPTQATLIISIFDMQGRMVKETETRNEEVTWDLTGRSGVKVPPGMYFCKYVTGQKVGSIKILVE